MKTKKTHIARAQNDNRGCHCAGCHAEEGLSLCPPLPSGNGTAEPWLTGKRSSKTRREILLVGNRYQLSGSLRWVLLPNPAKHLARRASDCKTAIRAATAGAKEVFTRDVELVSFARQRALSVQQGHGVWLLFGQWPRWHPKCFFPEYQRYG